MKRITSSLLALLLALSMLIGMVPAAYAAPADTIESIDSTETVDSSETEDVLDEAEEVAVYATTEGKAAKIGDNEYDTLAEAFAAAVTGDTVTLMRNVDLNGSSLRLYPSDTGVHNLTLDLARYKITSNIKGYVVAAAREGLVIKNGTIENTNTSTAKTTSAVYVTNAGTTTFENVQITSKGAGVRVQLKTGVATVNVGNGTAIDAKYGVHLANPTNTFTTKSGTEILNVNGGTITGSTWGVLAECASSSYTNASVGVNIKAGSVNSVNVNTNTATSKNDPVKLEISGGVITGNVKSNGTADEISISGGEIQGSITNNGTLTISGGTIGGSLTNGTNGAISVTGGTFTTADPSDYLADGYEFVNGQVTSSSSTTAITTSEQLIAAIAAANDGDTITLGEGEFSTYRNTSPNKSLTFVGSGEKTRWMIGNIPALDKEGEYNSDYSFDGCETITFKNMTMVNGAANYLGFVRIGNSNFENCTFEGRGSYWGYKTATFTRCTFNAPEGDYALWDYSTPSMTFDECTFNINGKGVNVYVEAGNAGSATRTVTVKDCTVISTKEDKAFLNIKNSTQAYDVTFSGTNTVNGLAANATTGSNLFQVETTKVTETSGNPVTVKETAADGTEKVIYEVKADTVPSGYVEDENGNVSISDADGLFWLAKQVNENGNTFAGKTVVLAADIDLKNAAWTPIGTSTNQFKGTFDGQNKTISNISANCPSMENVGLFGFATNCTLKNVTLENVDIKGKKNVGGLAGTVFAGSTVENVTVKGNIKISASVQYVGGIAGGYSYAKYVNCKVIGDGADSSYIQDTLVGDYTNYAGGIVGLYGEGAAGITGCEVSDITIRTVGYGAGGITGVLQYNNRVSDCKVKNVVIDSQPADSNGWAGTLAGKDYTSNGSNTSWLINNTIENTVIKVGGVEIANQYMGDDHTGTYPPHEEYEANAIIGTDVEYDELGKITAGTFITVGAKARETLESSISDSKSLSKGSDDTYNVTEKKAYVAEINGTGYETLAEAVKAAAAGDTITLLSDIKLTSVQTISKKLTLDLNGKTLDSTAYRTIQLNFGADLTVQDSVGTGKIANSYNGSSYPSTVYLNAKDTVFTLVSGTIESDPYKTSLQSVAINSEKDKACTVNIQGGSVVVPAAAKEGRAIVASTNSMTLNIKGGTITGGLHGIDAYSGSTVNITGGKVTATYVDTGVIKEAYGMRIKGTANVTINGGEIQGIKMDDDGYKLDVPNVTLVSGKVNGSFYSITKGTIVFTVDPTATITFENDTVKNFLPSTVELVRNEDGTYGVTKKVTNVAEVNGNKYETLQAAIDATPRNGTVKLLADTRENVTISTPYVTLDLNGFTLNGSTGERKPALTVTARVTVKDSSVAQTGTIMREDTADNSGVSSHYVIDVQGGGWLTFESGNVKNGSGVVGVKGASLVRVGDDSVAKYPGLNIKGGTFTQDNFIVIKVDRGDLFLSGGTLNSANSYAIEDWHRATIKGGTVNGAVAAWTYSGGLNSDLTISGGTINGDVTSVNYGNAEGKTAKVSITGGTINGKLDTRSYDPATNELTSIDDAAKATIEVTGGTFKNDPTKYVVENSKVTNNADGTFGVEKAYLAKVGETSYYTMDEAFKAQTASGKPIVLLRDYTTGSPFNSGTINRTVDLNGHTWTCTGTDANSAAFEINNPNVTLTVKNGKIVSSQLVGLIPSAMGGTIKYDNSGLVFEGVEMSTTATSGIETNGSNTNDSVTLKNSTLNVPNGFGIYFPSSGKLTIENSTINAKTMGVQVCAGSLSINEGSAITVSDGPVDKTENDGAIQDGAAISIVNRTGYKGLDTITVTGGTFTAKTGNAAIKAYDWANNTATDFTEPTKVEVSGGTFSAEVPADLCAPGYVPKDNGDGTYGVKKGTYVAAIGEKKYATLAAAVDAAQNGDTITLLADVEQNTMLVIKKDITLDLAGKKIFNTTDIWSDANGSYELLSIEAKVTITGNGTIDAKENDCYTINVKNGDLTIENGTFYGNVSVVQVEAGMLTINGGKFDLHQKWEGKNTYLINCIDDAFVAKTAKVAIYGGEFVDFDPNVSPEKKIDGKTPSFAAPGVGITKNENNTFTAKPNMVAQIVDADGNSVAAYASLAEAVATAKDNEIVKLLADTDISTTGLTITETITLDLNGYTIEAANTDKGNIKVCGKLTLMDSTDTKKDGTGAGKIFTRTSYKYGETDKVLVVAMSGGTFIMESGLIDAASSIVDNANNGQFAVSVQNDNGDAAVIINGGHIKAGWYAVAGNGTNTKHNGDITVNGGILESTADYAIYHPHTGTTTINGGTIYGAAGGVSLNRGKLVVNGGTITSKGTGSTGDWGDGTGKQDAAAINVNAQYDSTSVEIKGGTITAENDAILLTNGRNGTIAVSGGQFSHVVKAEYCAIGYQPKTTQDPNTKLYTVEKVNGNAYYVDDSGKPVYGNFVDLVNYTNDATVNKTITLLDNVTVNGYMLLFEGRSVDLSGFELTITKKLIANDGSVSDSSDGKGLLKIAADSATLVSNNGQIPLYDTENQGYRLFNCTIKDALQTISNTSVKLWVGAIFTNKDAYKLLRTGNEHNIKIVVTLRWKNSQDTAGEQTFAFTQSLINKVALTNGEDAFYIVLTGLDTDLTGSISEVTAQGGITSGTGVSISGEEYTLTK